MEFKDATLEQATAFHAFYLGSQEIFLRDLAWAMREAPEIVQMDGSYDSLVPLWTWARMQADAGLPSVTQDARPTSAIFLGSPIARLDRYNVLGELIERYVMEAVMANIPEAEWAVGVGAFPGDWRHNRTTLLMPKGHFFGSAGLGVQLWIWAEKGIKKDADSLYFTVTGARYEWRSSSPGASILTPLLDQPPLAWDDPRRSPPLASETRADIRVRPVKVEPAGTAPGETELIFAAIGTDVEDFDRAKPLDESAVAATLADLGFAVSEGLLKISETQLEHPNAAILVETFSYRKRLRALHFELHGSDEVNLAVVAAFTTLGHRIHARLGSEDDWTNNR